MQRPRPPAALLCRRRSSRRLQFGYFSGQLGDGATMYLGEVGAGAWAGVAGRGRRGAWAGVAGRGRGRGVLRRGLSAATVAVVGDCAEAKRMVGRGRWCASRPSKRRPPFCSAASALLCCSAAVCARWSTGAASGGSCSSRAPARRPTADRWGGGFFGGGGPGLYIPAQHEPNPKQKA